MNVSLPFASPARKQDTTNNNKQGQPHDTFAWWQQFSEVALLKLNPQCDCLDFAFHYFQQANLDFFARLLIEG